VTRLGLYAHIASLNVRKTSDLSLLCVCIVLSVQGLMFQCRMALRPDGLFLAALFGGETLQVCVCVCVCARIVCKA
jgi:NADH dehydrogenase [ubiquinone] 1 alpha subcomplex assembly factor 5